MANIRWVPSVTALRAETGMANGEPAILAGYSGTDRSGGTVRFSTSVPTSQTITGASGAPIRITTQTPHGLSTGQRVSIGGVGGNKNANKNEWVITSTGLSTFTLNGSTSGPEDYTGGGFVGDGGYMIPSNSATAGMWYRVSSHASPIFWGAVVGGSASANKSAVQAAFDFCTTYNMELRWEFEGQLDVDDELLLHGNFKMTGAGRDKTVIRQTATGKNLLRITARVTDAVWRDFGLSCDADAGHVLCFGEVLSYAITAIDSGAKKFTVSGTGAASNILAADVIRVRGGGANNRTYTVNTVTTNAGNTEIIVAESIASGTVAGNVEWMQAKRFSRNLVQNVDLHQDNTSNSCIYGLWNRAGAFLANRFEHIRLLGAKGHASPLIDLASNGNDVQSAMFTDVWAEFGVPPDGCGADYVARIACHSPRVFFDQLVFENWVVERANGGVIHLIGANHSVIRNVQMYDNRTITKDLIRLESNADASPRPNRMNLLEMIVRQAGTNSDFYDIWIDKHTQGNVLSACQGIREDKTLKIQFNENKAALVGTMFQTLVNDANVAKLASS